MSDKIIAERETDVKVVSELRQLKDENFQMKVVNQLEELKDTYYQRDIW
ncbi:hypothetical protein [Desulfosporosinus sp. OT]|nr:hypothetical protein [Desulfosporosinus sp. OT]EGW36990.1 hypothetical protein DOT_5180 [Desulfosporosinus sp. OT]